MQQRKPKLINKNILIFHRVLLQLKYRKQTAFTNIYFQCLFLDNLYTCEIFRIKIK